MTRIGESNFTVFTKEATFDQLLCLISAYSNFEEFLTLLEIFTPEFAPIEIYLRRLARLSETFYESRF